jgi:hypothetical protein
MILLGLFVLLSLGFFAYVYLNQGRAGTDETAPNPVSDAPNETMRRINALHQFSNGTHTIVGETEVPTPCHILTTAASQKNNQPNDIEIRFTATTTAETCAQLVTPARFKVTFTAPQNAMIQALWNGAPAILNLIPATPADNLDSFEEYFKG